MACLMSSACARPVSSITRPAAPTDMEGVLSRGRQDRQSAGVPCRGAMVLASIMLWLESSGDTL